MLEHFFFTCFSAWLPILSLLSKLWSFRFPDGPAIWSGWPVDCPADGQCPWARDGHLLMLGIAAGVELARCWKRAMGQYQGCVTVQVEGDTVYETSLALCPWTIMTEFQKALREGQGQARPKWPSQLTDALVSLASPFAPRASAS